MKTVIIGGGASGISAAIRLKQLNSDMSVTVIEHLGEIMKKIYATGNGRCNIANKNAEHYDEVKDFLSSLGLILREDEKGRMYPYSNQASSVVEVFKAECKKLGIEILTDCNVKNADCYENTFHIYTDKGIIDSDYLILATGGKSQPPLGSDGSGYALSKKFGHNNSTLPRSGSTEIIEQALPCAKRCAYKMQCKDRNERRNLGRGLRRSFIHRLWHIGNRCDESFISHQR